MTADLDYLAQQAMQTGILPSDFYNSSFSDLQAALSAKEPKDRVQDPLDLARNIGAL